MKIMLVTMLLSFLANGARAEELKYGHFGRVGIERGEGAPERLVIYFGGSEPAKGASPELAKAEAARIAALREKNTVVVKVGPGFRRALLKRAKKTCVYPAGDLEELSKFVQTKLKFPEYRAPILVGFGDEAVLSYGALAQAPKNTFAGAVSVGFCPIWNGAKKFCGDHGLKSVREKKGFRLEPAGQPLPNWRVIGAGKACDAEIPGFVAKVSGAKFSAAGVEVAEQVRAAAAEMHATDMVASPFKGDAAIEKLPLVSIEPVGPAKGLVVFYSGDGGWAGFDQGVSAELAKAGQRIVGLSSLKYFWTAKEPDRAAADLVKILQHFAKEKSAGPVRLVGYSFGADVMPEIVSRLPDEMRAKIASVSLLGLSNSATFEFHFTDWLGGSEEGLPVAPVVKKLSEQMKIRCLYGTDEEDSLCPELDPKRVEVRKLPGGHNFNDDSAGIAKIILAP